MAFLWVLPLPPPDLLPTLLPACGLPPSPIGFTCLVPLPIISQLGGLGPLPPPHNSACPHPTHALQSLPHPYHTCACHLFCHPYACLPSCHFFLGEAIPLCETPPSLTSFPIPPCPTCLLPCLRRSLLPHSPCHTCLPFAPVLPQHSCLHTVPCPSHVTLPLPLWGDWWCGMDWLRWEAREITPPLGLAVALFRHTMHSPCAWVGSPYTMGHVFMPLPATLCSCHFTLYTLCPSLCLPCFLRSYMPALPSPNHVVFASTLCALPLSLPPFPPHTHLRSLPPLLV